MAMLLSNINMKTQVLVFFILFTNVATAEIVDNLEQNINIDNAQNLNIVNLNAVQTAFNNSSDTDNIKICRYSSRTICKIRIRERMPAIIQLPQNDKIKTFVLGDSETFNFSEIDSTRTRAKLSGNYPGADTNLAIVGESGFIYSFYVRIDSVKSKFLSDFIVNIRLNRNDDDKLRSITSKQKKEQLTSKNIIENSIITKKPTKKEFDYLDKKSSININQLNFNFSQTNGDKALMPLKIFDDGAWTYFQYGKNNLINKTKLPVIYAVRDGYDMPINSRIEGEYLILETISNKWTIRSGESFACVQKAI